MASDKSLFVLGLLMCFGSAVVSGQATAENGACRDGWTFHEGLCYGFNSQTANWPEAQAYCHSFGAKLPEPNSEANIKFLRAMAQDKNVVGIWLGGTDSQPGGVWRWASTGQVISPTDWYPGEPNNVAGEESCLQIYKAEDNFQWNDNSCGKTWNFACEYRP